MAIGANAPLPGSPGRDTSSQTPARRDQAEPGHPHFATEGGERCWTFGAQPSKKPLETFSLVEAWPVYHEVTSFLSVGTSWKPCPTAHAMPPSRIHNVRKHTYLWLLPPCERRG